MDLNDVIPEKFFAKVTFESDTHTYTPPKLKIPDGDFILSAILLRLINVINNKL